MPAVPLSRYEFVAVEQDEQGRTFLQPPDPLPKTVFQDEEFVTTREGETFFSLAFRRYRELADDLQDILPANFFWVLADLNDIVDVTKPIPVGTRLRIPSTEALLSVYTAPPPFFSRNNVD